jgi:hypothetical protein
MGRAIEAAPDEGKLKRLPPGGVSSAIGRRWGTLMNA